MKIEIIYASKTHQCCLEQVFPEHFTAKEAIENSGILLTFPEIDLNTMTMGIFGKKVSNSTSLKSGDRIEIYRPLIIDPMTRRRLVAKKQKFK